MTQMARMQQDTRAQRPQAAYGGAFHSGHWPRGALAAHLSNLRNLREPSYLRNLCNLRESLWRRRLLVSGSGRIEQGISMCRNIKTLANFAPPATDDEIRASALQFVRKLSGTNKPSKANEAAFNAAVEDVTAA